ncbi:RING-HC finger protein [Spongorhabdus nitratireducens]
MNKAIRKIFFVFVFSFLAQEEAKPNTLQWMPYTVTDSVIWRLPQRKLEVSDIRSVLNSCCIAQDKFTVALQKLFSCQPELSETIEAALLPLLPVLTRTNLVCPVTFRNRDGHNQPAFWVFQPDGKVRHLTEKFESSQFRAITGGTEQLFIAVCYNARLHIIKITSFDMFSAIITPVWLDSLEEAAIRSVSLAHATNFTGYTLIRLQHQTTSNQQLKTWTIRSESEDGAVIDLDDLVGAVSREAEKPVPVPRRDTSIPKHFMTTPALDASCQLVSEDTYDNLSFEAVASSLPQIWNQSSPFRVRYRMEQLAPSAARFNLTPANFKALAAAGFMPLTTEQKHDYTTREEDEPTEDTVCCIHCDLHAGSWEEEDNPWNEHQRLSVEADSPCPYSFMGQTVCQRRAKHIPYFCIASPPDEGRNTGGMLWFSQGTPLVESSLAEIHVVQDHRSRKYAFKVYTGGTFSDPERAQQSFLMERENYLTLASYAHNSNGDHYSNNLSFIISQGITCGGIHDSSSIIVMEALEQTLQRYLSHTTPNCTDRLKAIRAMINGLDFVHRAGLALIDLTPGNFMITETGAWRWIDFSEARPLNSTVEPDKFPPGYKLGFAQRLLDEPGQILSARDVDMIRLAFMVGYTLHGELHHSTACEGQTPYYFAQLAGASEYDTGCFVEPQFSYLSEGSHTTVVTIKEALSGCANCMLNPKSFTLSSFRQMLKSALKTAELSAEEFDITTPVRGILGRFVTDFCIICFDSKVELVNLECGHTNTCMSCLQQWLKRKSHCPTCRQRITFAP